MIRRSLVIAGLAALALGAVNDAALAQFYKGKTITMIINYPAGGPSDIEGRIIAQHLPAHLPGKPTIIIKNVGGAGGVIGTNQLGEAAPNGETMGFFTLDIIAQLLSNPALRVNYADFVMIAGVENPLVAYARKDIPPGLKVATDIMKTKDFKALSLNVQNSNTLNQALSLDLLGLKYQAVPAFRGLKEVETAILQNEGQFANTSLPGWRGSIESCGIRDPQTSFRTGSPEARTTTSSPTTSSRGPSRTASGSPTWIRRTRATRSRTAPRCAGTSSGTRAETVCASTPRRRAPSARRA